MAKRRSSYDLNHDNWDDPIEEEEAGTFQAASDENLQKRVIKQARRRLKPSENSDKSIFAKFTGFKPTIPVSNSAGSSKPFGFLGDVTSSTSPTVTSNGAAGSPSTTKMQATHEQTYVSNLQQLNRSVSDWIKTHVDANPVCILTPVFNDYEKHLKQIQSERDAKEKSSSSPVSAPSSFPLTSISTSNSNKFSINIPTTLENNKKTFTFTDTSSLGTSKPDQSLVESSKESGKSPLQTSEPRKPTTLSIFSTFKNESTGSSLLTKPPDPAALMVNPFLSGLKKEDKREAGPFSFSNGPATTSPSAKEEEEDESDEPPKLDIPPIEEENAVFTSRCKVFVKKDSSYRDKGVGTLFIKKVEEDKYQLLVRAETALRSILLNVLLSKGIPTKRMGKNNVMLVCLPTPEDPPPTTVLLRVKTAADADDLLKTIDQYIH